MCSEIDPHTRHDPQAALLHNDLLNQVRPSEHQVVNPESSDKPQQQFDSEAHRSFMRGLG